MRAGIKHVAKNKRRGSKKHHTMCITCCTKKLVISKATNTSLFMLLYKIINIRSFLIVQVRNTYLSYTTNFWWKYQVRRVYNAGKKLFKSSYPKWPTRSRESGKQPKTLVSSNNNYSGTPLNYALLRQPLCVCNMEVSISRAYDILFVGVVLYAWAGDHKTAFIDLFSVWGWERLTWWVTVLI